MKDKYERVIGNEEEELFIEQRKKEGQDKPSQLERKYVYEVYDKIAGHFSETRYKAWPLIQEHLEGMEAGSFVLDVGCGNGKYLFCVEHLNMIGTDVSGSFMKICAERGGEVFTADSLKLPVRDNWFDHVISVAVIHHFSTEAMRRRAVQELVRVVKPGGTVLIYVWAFDQEKKFSQPDVFVPWNLQKKY